MRPFLPQQQTSLGWLGSARRAKADTWRPPRGHIAQSMEGEPRRGRSAIINRYNFRFSQ